MIITRRTEQTMIITRRTEQTMIITRRTEQTMAILEQEKRKHVIREIVFLNLICRFSLINNMRWVTLL